MSRRRGAIIAGTFGVFQAVMPMAGWLCVHTIVELFSAFERFVPWIALALLGYIGGKMLMEGIKGEEAEETAELSAGALFKTIITGQLGDVMKESSAIAQALVQSRFPEQAELFEKNDLHIHVPDGSTPKDGPSAGITMTTAIASLVTGIPVPPNIAMTGEVSLEGVVSAIGGLPEKLMAAERAGVQKVFIPKENIDDLRDVAAEVRDRLEIIPVESIEEVLTALGILKHK